MNPIFLRLTREANGDPIYVSLSQVLTLEPYRSGGTLITFLQGCMVVTEPLEEVIRAIIKAKDPENKD